MTQEPKYFLKDTINGEFEGIDSVSDAKQYVRDCFVDNDSIHPDFQSFDIYKKVGNVYIIEEGETVVGIEADIIDPESQYKDLLDRMAEGLRQYTLISKQRKEFHSPSESALLLHNKTLLTEYETFKKQS